MGTVQKSRKLVQSKVSWILFFSDIISVVFGFSSALVLSHIVQQQFFDLPATNYNGYDFLSLIMYPALLTLFYIKGYYTQRVPWWSQVRYIFGICLIAFISDILIRLFLQLPVHQFFITLSAAFIFGFILLGRQITCFVLRKLKVWQIETVIIGNIETVTDILYAFHADYYAGYDVKTVLIRDRKDKIFDLGTVPKSYADITVIREQIEYQDFVTKNADSFFVISLETFRGEERDKFIQYLTDNNIIYSVAPPTSSMSLFEMKPHNFFGSDIMLLHSKVEEVSLIKRFVKRLIDISVSFTALTILSPIFLLVSLCLKLEGQGGSVFYGGNRLGRQGQSFHCWKFRSMEPDSDHLLHALIESDPEIKADWEKYRKLKVQDPRVTTKTARLIRKLSIDELPQLWNVLMGDMSVVGPRPILPNEEELFGESYKNYIKVRPGITGLWQVSGRNETSFKRRIHMDNWYVRNWSIWGDIVIMIKTLNVVIRGSGSY